MAIKPEELSAYVGLDLDSIEDVDALKAAFDGAFVRRDHAHDDEEVTRKVFGKVNSIGARKVGRLVEEFSLPIEVDPQKPFEAIDAIAPAMKERISKLTQDLDAAKKGGKGNEELTKQLDALKAERDAAFAQAKDFEVFKTKYEDLTEQLTRKEQQDKLDAVYTDALSGVEFNPELPKVAVTGFNAIFRERYQPVFTEAGVRWKDKDGKLVMDPLKSQVYRDGKSIAKELAEAEKLTGKPSAPVRKVITPAAMGGQPEQQQQAPPPGGVRRVRPLPEPRLW
jgi:Skp family chaperone for outer membrane proteins